MRSIVCEQCAELRFVQPAIDAVGLDKLLMAALLGDALLGDDDDAVGACMAVPDTPHYRRALAHGDTLGPHRQPCIHWVATGKDRWVDLQRAAGWRIVAVELADGAVSLPRLQPAQQRTVVLLGHEWHGVPEEQVDRLRELSRRTRIAQSEYLREAVDDLLGKYGKLPSEER